MGIKRKEFGSPFVKGGWRLNEENIPLFFYFLVNFFITKYKISCLRVIEGIERVNTQTQKLRREL